MIITAIIIVKITISSSVSKVLIIGVAEAGEIRERMIIAILKENRYTPGNEKR